VDIKQGQIALGIIARDWEGQVLVAQSTTRQFIVEPLFAEALAALHVVIFSKEIGFTQIMLEGDAIQIVREINSESSQLRRNEHLVDDIKNVLSSLHSFKVIHVKRTANGRSRSRPSQGGCYLCHKFNLVGRYSPIIYDIVCREGSFSWCRAFILFDVFL